VLPAVSAPGCARKEAPAEATASAQGSASPPKEERAVRPKAPAQPAPDRVPVASVTQRDCDAICEHSRELGCKNAGDCMRNCMAMGALTPCTEPVAALYRCLVAQPTKNWECDEDGVAAIRQGFCDKEQGKTVACMEEKMQP
jgi:hypothetical protein